MRGCPWGGRAWLLWGGMHGCSGGHVWLLQGGMHGCSRGACMCGCLGGMCGCSGGMCGCSGGHVFVVALGGACVVAPGACVCGCSGGHVWLLWGACVCGCSGGCVVAPGGMCGCSRGGRAWDTTRYGDTINGRAVRILLECILVSKAFARFNNVWSFPTDRRWYNAQWIINRIWAGSVCGGRHLWIDRLTGTHDRKHYLPATSRVGDDGDSLHDCFVVRNRVCSAVECSVVISVIYHLTYTKYRPCNYRNYT